MSHFYILWRIFVPTSWQIYWIVFILRLTMSGTGQSCIFQLFYCQYVQQSAISSAKTGPLPGPNHCRLFGLGLLCAGCLHSALNASLLQRFSSKVMCDLPWHSASFCVHLINFCHFLKHHFLSVALLIVICVCYEGEANLKEAGNHNFSMK